MQKLTIDMTMEIFDLLANNIYSVLWDLTENFLCNGHVVQIKNRPYWYSVVIDDKIVSINPSQIIYSNDIKYVGYDYARHILSERGEYEQ